MFKRRHHALDCPDWLHLTPGRGRRQRVRLRLLHGQTAGEVRRHERLLHGAHPDALQELPQLQVVVWPLRIADPRPHLVHGAPAAVEHACWCLANIDWNAVHTEEMRAACAGQCMAAWW